MNAVRDRSQNDLFADDDAALEAPLFYPQDSAPGGDGSTKRRGSKWNAVRHGMMAKTLFPVDLEAQIARCTAILTEHDKPATPYEVRLVNEMGRASAQVAHGRNLKVLDQQRAMDWAVQSRAEADAAAAVATGDSAEETPDENATAMVPPAPGAPDPEADFDLPERPRSSRAVLKYRLQRSSLKKLELPETANAPEEAVTVRVPFALAEIGLGDGPVAAPADETAVEPADEVVVQRAPYIAKSASQSAAPDERRQRDRRRRQAQEKKSRKDARRRRR
jgi:hypothetical protein